MSRRDLRLSKGSILRNAHGEDRLLSSSIWFILGEQLKFLSQICPWQVSCQGLIYRGPDVADLEHQPIVLHRLTGMCFQSQPPCAVLSSVNGQIITDSNAVQRFYKRLLFGNNCKW